MCSAAGRGSKPAPRGGWGFVLAQGGEFAFVLFTAGVSAGA